MAMGVPITELLAKIGHDGSAIIFPALSEPQCRQAFHPQECVLAALACGHGFVHFEWQPVSTPDGFHTHEPKMDHDWMISKIIQGPTVAVGFMPKSGRRHAVAIEGGKVYDPNGTIYDFEIKGFDTFWLKVI
jgi:hypothetical protein